MNLLKKLNDIFSKPNKSLVQLEIEQIKETGYTNLENKRVFDYYPIYNSAKLPFRNKDRHITVTSDFYLYKMEKYYETESLLTSSIHKLSELLNQKGFVFNCENTEILTKIENELKKILKNSDRPKTLKSYIRKMTQVLPLYGNIFIKKIYDINGKIISLKFLDPLAVKAVLDKETDTLKGWVIDNGLRKRGDLDKFISRQKTSRNLAARYAAQYRPNVFYRKDSEDQFIELNEIDHIKYIDMDQNIICMPPFYPVVEDIITLRAIEDDMTLLSYQYGHPLLHATIDREGMSDSELEYESKLLAQKISSMEGNGLLVTSNRVVVELKGPQGNPPDLVEYHSIFKKRVEKGLGIPDLFTGSGENTGRQSAESIEKSLYGKINDFGNLIADSIQTQLDEIWNRNIKKIQDPYYYEDCPVKVIFKEADVNEDRANEQHVTTLWQSSALTHGEYRSKLGESIDPSLDSKYYHDISQEQKEREMKVSAELKSRLTPQNQYGKKTKSGSRKN